MATHTNPVERIKEKAKELGFIGCGIAKADHLHEEESRLTHWLQNNQHGEMSYMGNHFDKRLDPRLLVENARSIVSVLLNYFPASKQTDINAPILSKYAFGVDYHQLLKEKLGHLLLFIQTEISPCQGRCFVDSAPVLERAWAARAGLGWIGKNTNLVTEKHGSFFFIGELIIDLELAANETSAKNRCGNCTRCIDACPTQALVSPFVLDARKCISYQTIENRADIDSELKGKFEGRVFGCDICQDVCPWNTKLATHNEPDLVPATELMELTEDEWHNIDKQLFDKLFGKSAVKRTKFEGLKRNLQFLKD